MKLGNYNLEELGTVRKFKIATPKVREKTYEVPGRHGIIDASEALTGYPIYDNREITVDLFVKKKTAKEYQDFYDEIRKNIHGKTLKFFLPFDEEYYFKGRWSVEISQTSLSSGTIEFKADCYPYALKKELTIIDVSSATGEERSIKLPNAGMPTELYITTNAGITIKRGNKDGTYKGDAVILEPLLIEEETIIVSGIGNAKIYYQEGKL